MSRLPYNLYCVGGDVKHCSLTHSLTHSPSRDVIGDVTNRSTIGTFIGFLLDTLSQDINFFASQLRTNANIFSRGRPKNMWRIEAEANQSPIQSNLYCKNTADRTQQNNRQI